jgi:hypothetical protein
MFVCLSLSLPPSLIPGCIDQRLDLPIDPVHRPRHVTALIRLSKRSGLFPECLILTDISLGQHPITRGGYGDVYKGVLQGKYVAVKALRVYQDSNWEKLLKVIAE